MAQAAPGVFLLVEDDPNDQLLIRRAFEKASTPARVLLAGDGDEAIAYLSGAGNFADRRRFPMPNVILLDLKLPRRSGLEVLGWIRGHAVVGRLPVVVLTSSRQPRDIEMAYDLRANSYLVKPVDLSALERLIARVGEYWVTLNELPDPEEPGDRLA